MGGGHLPLTHSVASLPRFGPPVKEIMATPLRLGDGYQLLLALLSSTR